MLTALVLPAAVVSLGAQEVVEPPRDRPPFVVLNQDRLLTGSRAGQKLLDDEEAARDSLRSEARAIDSAFETEERALTERRAEVDPEEFRALADAFDVRVIAARKEQDERAATLAQTLEETRRQFYAQIAPILVAMMNRTGAVAVFDENSVLLFDQTLDITDAVIAEIDAAYDVGSPEPVVPQVEPAAAPKASE